jgi:predicted nucleic acid-binding protein
MPARVPAGTLAGAVVVDASVVVEYLVALSLTTQAQILFRALVERDLELWAPDLVYPESLSALRRLVALRAIEARAADRGVGQLLRLPIMVVGTRELGRRAWELRGSLTPYDACYAALAEALAAPLITADRRFARDLAARGASALFLGDLATRW